MPFYDLYCTACDKEYNISATMADKSERLIPCPDCGAYDLVTIYNSAPAYIKASDVPACPGSGACGVSGCRHAK